MRVNRFRQRGLESGEDGGGDGGGALPRFRPPLINKYMGTQQLVDQCQFSQPDSALTKRLLQLQFASFFPLLPLSPVPGAFTEAYVQAP